MNAAMWKDLLEAGMLVCFGFSWPINLYKNYKVRSAKGMSLPFILLIVIGYLFGIGAKIIGHVSGAAPLNYVFAVYIFNLVMVSGNIVVYFINKGYDRKNGLIK
ncbi:MAG: PQ-loop domain-containing transporter [Candidatus Faecivicinus sp.]